MHSMHSISAPATEYTSRWLYGRVRRAFLVLLWLALVPIATIFAPPAYAVVNPIGNFDVILPDRFDFHTWVWAVTPCSNGVATAPECVHVVGVARPIAKAFNYAGDAYLVDGRYTLTVDDPYGLRCGSVYYGPTSPTRDVYSWDATSLAGTLTSSFASGCDGRPGVLTYAFSLVRL